MQFGLKLSSVQESDVGSNKMFYTVSYLGYDGHGTCHGRNFQGGAKVACHNKNFYLQFLEPLFWAPTMNCEAAQHTHVLRIKSGVLRQLH